MKVRHGRGRAEGTWQLLQAGPVSLRVDSGEAGTGIRIRAGTGECGTLGQGPEGARGGHEGGPSRPFLSSEGEAASVRSINPAHSRGSRAQSIPETHRGGAGAEPVTAELGSLCPSSAVTLPQGWRPAGLGVAEGAAARRQGKLLSFVFERASSWPCVTCENVTHPESKQRMGRSDYCQPVYWKGERKSFRGFFLVRELYKVEQFLKERR